MTSPIVFIWDGEAMEPLPHFRKRCDDAFTIGERYRMEAVEERSIASHNHFFAVLTAIWMSLPDELAVQFPTLEIFRKHCLIMTGFRRERKFVASSKEEARKLAAFLRPQTSEDDYAIISLAETVVVEWKAMSQSRKAMPEKGQFHRSKQAVLDYAGDMIGVKPEELAKQEAA